MVIAAFAVMAVLLGFYWNRSQGPVEDDPVWGAHANFRRSANLPGPQFPAV